MNLLAAFVAFALATSFLGRTAAALSDNDHDRYLAIIREMTQDVRRVRVPNLPLAECGLRGPHWGHNLTTCNLWNNRETCCSPEIDAKIRNKLEHNILPHARELGKQLACASEYVVDNKIDGECLLPKRRQSDDGGKDKCVCVPLIDHPNKFRCINSTSVCDSVVGEAPSYVCERESDNTFGGCIKVPWHDHNILRLEKQLDIEHEDYCDQFPEPPPAAGKCGSEFTTLATNMVCAAVCDPEISILNPTNHPPEPVLCDDYCLDVRNICFKSFEDEYDCPDDQCFFNHHHDGEETELCFDGENFVNSGEGTFTSPASTILTFASLVFNMLF